LKTFGAQRLAGNEAEQEAYILERRPETLCRHALLMSIALDTSISLRERAEVFLEVYGNTLLSERGMRYVQQQSRALVQVLIGDDTSSVLARALDFSLLKHKEIDQLLTVAKLWADGMAFESEHYWDERLRQYYQSRYDARKNAADWDYHMKLKNLGASVISSREFTKWRLQGLAFEFGDKSYTKDNFTLGCYATGREGGKSVQRHGYWGDVVNSPYLAHGIVANKESLFKTRNNEHMHTASDVSKYNAIKLLHAFIDGKNIDPPASQSGVGGDFTETPGELPDDVNEKAPDSYPNAKLVMMLGEPPLLLRRQRYSELFDTVYVAATSGTEDLSTVVATLAPLGGFIIETAKYVLDFRKEYKTEFLRRLYEATREAGLQLLPMMEKAYQGKGAPQDGEAATHLKFIKPESVDVAAEGTIAIPELEVPEKLKKEPEEPAKPEASEEGANTTPADDDDGVIQVKHVPPPEKALKHGNEVDYQIVQRHQSRFSNRPRELLVRVKIPGLASASQLDLDITENSMKVTGGEESTTVDLNIKLPFPVDKDGGSAQFDSVKSTLSITLPVVQGEEDSEQNSLVMTEEGAAEAEDEAPGKEENVMARDQKAMDGLRRMNVPTKLGQDIFLGGI